MDRGEEDVVALPEDLLRAVAVVEIEVEEGDAGRALLAQAFGGAGGIVEIAVAAGGAPSGVMARRAAAGEDGALTRRDEVGGGQGDGGRGAHRPPGALDEGGTAVEGVEAEQRTDRLRLQIGAQIVGRPDHRQRRADVARGRPQIPGLGEEVDVIGVVNPTHGVETLFRRADHRAEAAFLRLGEDETEPLGLLVTRLDDAGAELHLAGMAEMVGGPHDLHGLSPQAREKAVARAITSSEGRMPV